MSKSTESKGYLIIIVPFFIFFLFAWLRIPELERPPNTFELASFTFANNIFSGWGDELATYFLYSDTISQKENSMSAFKATTIICEKVYPILNTVFSILGALFSIGGAFAVFAARGATSLTQAFSLGFSAEIVESVIYHLGYKSTVGEFSIPLVEIYVTLIIALIMGLVACFVYSGHVKKIKNS
jgi:hypothetical protein